MREAAADLVDRDRGLADVRVATAAVALSGWSDWRERDPGNARHPVME